MAILYQILCKLLIKVNKIVNMLHATTQQATAASNGATLQSKGTEQTKHRKSVCVCVCVENSCILFENYSNQVCANRLKWHWCAGNSKIIRNKYIHIYINMYIYKQFCVVLVVVAFMVMIIEIDFCYCSRKKMEIFALCKTIRY